jgi:hypothetical protein
MLGFNYAKFDAMTYVLHYQNGVIFSDGIESDFLRFNSGAIATVGVARLVVK